MSCRSQKTKIWNGKPGFEAVFATALLAVSSVSLSETRQTHSGLHLFPNWDTFVLTCVGKVACHQVVVKALDYGPTFLESFPLYIYPLPHSGSWSLYSTGTSADHSAHTCFQWRPSPRKWSNHLASSVPPTHHLLHHTVVSVAHEINNHTLRTNSLPWVQSLNVYCVYMTIPLPW